MENAHVYQLIFYKSWVKCNKTRCVYIYNLNCTPENKNIWIKMTNTSVFSKKKKSSFKTFVGILSFPNQTNSLSMAICTDWIWGFSCEPSFIVTEVAITGRDTPHARPKACLERTNTYGTFLSSHSSGKWRMISRGSASAAITMNSEIPRLSVLVAGGGKKKEEEIKQWEIMNQYHMWITIKKLLNHYLPSKHWLKFMFLNGSIQFPFVFLQTIS